MGESFQTERSLQNIISKCYFPSLLTCKACQCTCIAFILLLMSYYLFNRKVRQPMGGGGRLRTAILANAK